MNERASRRTEVTGYLHRQYAYSLAEFGVPCELPASGGWILRRQIPGSTATDAMGCYPLFTCQNWSRLDSDLNVLGDELVSVTLVASPFGDYEPGYLKNCFPDLFVAFKEHFVVDLNVPMDRFVHAHHRRNARKGLSSFEIEVCDNPSALLDDWLILYSSLIKRRGITGIAAFSAGCFRKQFAVPGIRVFRAVGEGAATAGMLLCYVEGNVAYYHLGAYSDPGYEQGASFALFSAAIEYFARQGLRWFNLGGGAGASSDGSTGLERFKQGWSTGTRTAFLCGRIFDHSTYNRILKSGQYSPTNYFPAYRAGELN